MARRIASLSKALRHDADRLRKQAVAAEHRMGESLHGWFVRFKPKVVQVEHRLEARARRALAKARASR
ncbi:MAG: hypothetical protein QOD77_347 [Thermoplasmata archaeon]|jgi:hypothetical protein|nr:hypothetical protein [Thermoplasmata archaeon]